MPSSKKRFVSLTRAHLTGHFNVHYDGDHHFDVCCTPTSTRICAVKSVKDLKKNKSCTPLRFTFEPKAGDKALPRWVGNGKKSRTLVDIEQVGAPYFGFTCVVDGEAYCGMNDLNSGKSGVGPGDRIKWVCCRNGDDLCVWTRIGSRKKASIKKSPAKKKLTKHVTKKGGK